MTIGAASTGARSAPSIANPSAPASQPLIFMRFLHMVIDEYS
jgi:hypothetical protein